MENRCPACMQPVTTEKNCPACGYEILKPNPVGALAVGSVLKERYTVGALLEEQPACQIYAGFDLVANDRVLLRVCSGRLKVGQKAVANRALLQQFLQFSRAMAEVNLCSVLPRTIDVFEQDGFGVAVHAYFEGTPLRALLHSNIAITKAHALQFAKELAAAFKALNTAGIVFGTACPGNIYILKNGELRLYGLGVSVFESVTDLELRAACINPSYAAPELFDPSAGDISPAADAYSLAAVLYRILCGRIPPVCFERPRADTLQSPRRFNRGLTAAQSGALLNGLNWQVRVRSGSAAAVLRQLNSPRVLKKYSPQTLFSKFLGQASLLFARLPSGGEKTRQTKSGNGQPAGGLAPQDATPAAEKEPAAEKATAAKKRKALPLVLLCTGLVVVLGTLTAVFVLLPKGKAGKGNTNSELVISGQAEQQESRIGTGYHDTSSTKPTYRTPQSSSSEPEQDGDLAICPTLTGKTIDEAENELQALGLRLGKINYRESESTEEGIILEQSIKSGLRVELGKAISVTVSSGSSNAVYMPEIVGTPLHDALAQLLEAGISYTLKFKTDAAGPGTVLAQSVEVGKKVTGTVTVTVSGKRLTVPDYTGKTVAELLSDGKLTVSGIKTAQGESLDPAAAADRKITAQSLKSGSVTFVGDQIELTVAD